MPSPFDRSHALIGMVHVDALPGTPRNEFSVDEICARAVVDARALAEAGFDAVMIENMHDTPYLRGEVGPEIVAGMTAVGCAVRGVFDGPLGVQILAGANAASLATAQAIDADFIRAEGFVFATVADEGLLDEAAAGKLLRYRKAIGARDIAVFADIKKKHSSHSITADLDIGATAEAAAFFGADAVVITGSATGKHTDPADVAAARAAVDLPIVVGSGGTPETLPRIFECADALIVGTFSKKDGDWRNPVDPARAKALVEAAAALRG
ncbi:MAG: BtpA/SgcQ family protein [Planctomycetes bacterium]|nr:BtpA/SgcQ family protein [Planctomycetota bacterium]